MPASTSRRTSRSTASRASSIGVALGASAMHTVQLAIEDAVYSAALRDTLMRSGPWRVVPVSVPDLDQQCVIVMDEDTFDGLAASLPAPERVVLITRKDPQHMSRAWDAGIV